MFLHCLPQTAFAYPSEHSLTDNKCLLVGFQKLYAMKILRKEVIVSRGEVKILYLSLYHPDQGGAHNGREESAGEQRAPFHHQFEVSTSLLLHIIIITISSN